jgi:hypothetical protein
MPVRDVRRSSRITKVSGAIAAIAFAWSILLFTVGGFDAVIAGVTVTSNNAGRPALAGLIAFAIFIWSHGWRQFSVDVGRVTDAVDGWLTRLRMLDRFVVPSLATAVLVGGVLGATGVAGGSDSFGYMSQAELWQSGLPIVSQPWSTEPPWPGAPQSFAPLGYKAVGDTIRPIYAVGLPLLMATAKRLGGQPAIFWLVPISAAGLVLVAYGLGRWLESARTGVVAAAFMATNWTLLSEMTSPMSDVVGAAGLAGAFFCLLGPRPRILAAGLVGAVAALVRPNLAPSVLVLLLWLALSGGNGSLGWRTRLKRVTIFLVALSPGLLIPAVANWRLFGSPLESGYGGVRAIYEWSSLPPNLLQYPRFLVETQAYLVFAGLLALCLPHQAIWPSVRRSTRIAILAFIASVVVPYLFFEPATERRYLRYLLPAAPFVMVGAARFVLAIAGRSVMAAAVALAVVVYCASSVRAVVNSGAFDQRIERRYPVVASLVRERTAPTSVIFAAQHSGSARYYGGRVTLHYDQLDGAWLDRAVTWLDEHGAHSYALLDYWEVPDFKRHFAGQHRLVALDAPVLIYRGGYQVYLYDLLRTSDARADPVLIVRDGFDGPRFPLPVDMPQFSFRRHKDR